MTSLKFLKVLLLSFFTICMLNSCEKDAVDLGSVDRGELTATDGDEATALTDDEDGVEDGDSEDDGDSDGLEFDSDCFEFVYPIEVAFPDGSVSTYADEDELELALEEWEDTAVDVTVLPEPVFPIEIILEDGTVSEIREPGEFMEIVASCEDEDGDSEDGDSDEEDGDSEDEDGDSEDDDEDGEDGDDD